jgi:Tfp pilus assembly protein PilZ
MLTLEESKKAHKKSFMERVIFEAYIHYEPIHENYLHDLCSDLSVGGLYLRTTFPFNIDKIVALSFSLPFQEQEISISCKARVAWTNFVTVQHKPAYPSGVGMQFLGLSFEDLTTLSKFIDSYDENKKMNVICAWCDKYLGVRKGPSGTTSHGICSQCCKMFE